MLLLSGRLLTFTSASFTNDAGEVIPFHRVTVTLEDGSVAVVKLSDDLARLVLSHRGQLQRYSLVQVEGGFDTYSENGTRKPCLKASGFATVDESSGEVTVLGRVESASRNTTDQLAVLGAPAGAAS